MIHRQSAFAPILTLTASCAFILSCAHAQDPPLHNSSPQGTDYGYPPLLLILPVNDEISSATLGASRRPNPVHNYFDALSLDKVKYSEALVQNLVRSQTDLESFIGKKKLGIDLAQFSSDKLVDVGVGQMTTRFPVATIISGIVRTATVTGLNAYYNTLRQEFDQTLVDNLRSNLHLFPRPDHVTERDVRDYFLKNGDLLLGTDTVKQLREKGASQQEIQEILIEEIDRLGTVIGVKGHPERAITIKDTGPVHELGGAVTRADFLLFEQRLGALTKAQDKLTKAVDDLSKNIETTNSRVNEMYQILYSQLPASRQREALLESLAGRQPTAAERSILEALSARELFEETIPSISNVVSDLATIAANAKLPLEYQRSLADLKQKIDLAATVGRDAISFNVLGVFAGMTSLIEGDFHDGATERFESIAKELSEIRKGQIALMAMVSQLGIAIAKTVALVEQVDVHLASVARTSRDGTETTYGLRDCLLLNETRMVAGSPYTFPNGSFKGFEGRRNHYKQHKTEFDPCLHGLKRVFVNSEGTDLSQLFQQDSETDLSGKPLSFEWASHYSQTLRIIANNSPAFLSTNPPDETTTGEVRAWIRQVLGIHEQRPDPDKILNRLFAMSLDSRSFKDIPSIDKALFTGTTDTSSFLPNAKTHYLSVLVIDKYVRYLLEYYPYYIFVNNDGRFREPKELIQNAQLPSEQERYAITSAMLVSALRLVNTAIVQQELLDSSITLTALTKSFLSWKWSDDSLCGNSLGRPVGRPSSDSLRRQFVSDNEETLKLLVRRDTLRRNWTRMMTISLFSDPQNAGLLHTFQIYDSNETKASWAGMLIDNMFTHKANCEGVAIKFCGCVARDVFFPRVFEPDFKFSDYATMKIPYGSGGPDISVELPIVPEGNDTKIEPEHGPEMFVLHSLRRQLLAALMQIHGFDTLSGEQRQLAAYLIIQNIADSRQKPKGR